MATPYTIPEPLTTEPILDDYIEAIKGASATGAGLVVPHQTQKLAINSTDLLSLLRHQMQLQWSLGWLKPLPGAESSAEAEAAFDAAQQSTDVLRHVIAQALGFDPLTVAPSSASSIKALEVFGVPELAEMILVQLRPMELLSAAQVNRTFAGAISSSTKIRDKLCLRPQPSSHWRTLFSTDVPDSLPGMQCVLWPRQGLLHTDEAVPTARTTMEMRVHVGTARLRRLLDYTDPPKVGARGRAVLICQPPVTELTAEASCCTASAIDHHSPTLPDRGPPATIRMSTGLTVGDLLTFAAQVRRDHQYCPYATRRHHDDEGNVVCTVSFKGSIELSSDDPYLIPIHAEQRRHHHQQHLFPTFLGQGIPTFQPHQYVPIPRPSPIPNPPKDFLDRYIEAKRAALGNSSAIPSPSEFRATEAMDGEYADESPEETSLHDAPDSGNMFDLAHIMQHGLD